MDDKKVRQLYEDGVFPEADDSPLTESIDPNAWIVHFILQPKSRKFLLRTWPSSKYPKPLSRTTPSMILTLSTLISRHVYVERKLSIKSYDSAASTAESRIRIWTYLTRVGIFSARVVTYSGTLRSFMYGEFEWSASFWKFPDATLWTSLHGCCEVQNFPLTGAW